ncbi:MAG: hypothetical protein H6842_03295 [Rhodospirillaceae bacterium]|nr:hypothetical protein [Rhodospirillaceae bacterium]
MRSIVLCGHNKCGTRWLAGVIAGSSTLRLVSPEGRGLTEADISDDGVDRLRTLVAASPVPVLLDFPHAIQNEATLAALKRIDPEMAAIVIYREPVDVMLSMHNYQRWSYQNGQLYGTPSRLKVDRRVRDDDLADAIIDGPLRAQYEDLYRYDCNARRLRAFFSRHHEALYDDLCEAPGRFVQAVFVFCGAVPDVEVSAERVNRSLAVRSWFLDRLISKSFFMLTGMNSRALYDHYKTGKLRGSPYRFLLRLNDKPAHFLKAGERQRLKDFFAPMVQEFFAVSGLDLRQWGYPVDARDEGPHQAEGASG